MAEHPIADGELRSSLVAHGLLIPTSVRGVFGRGHAFEALVDRIDAIVAAESAREGAEVVRFPPVIPRRILERGASFESFPHLVGSIFGFGGDEGAHVEMLSRIERGAPYGNLLEPTDLVLAPAACYALYPTVAGVLPAGGRLFDVASYCFRREPSTDPARMQAFRMRELVRVAEPAAAREFRDRWIDRARLLLRGLGLAVEAAPANDPFFGRGGRMLAANQRVQDLKIELVYPLAAGRAPTALMSFNDHRDHFGASFGIRTADGEVAHTSCVGFGLERIALAIFATHGFDPSRWPAELVGSGPAGSAP